jgi:serine/threonine protein phosphatase PrpC
LGIFDGHGGSNLVEKINEAFPQYLRENVEKCYKKNEKEILNVNDLSKIFSKSFD